MRFYAVCVRCTLILSVLLAGVNLLALVVRYPSYALIPAGFFAAKNLAHRRVSTGHGSARPSGIPDLLARGMIGSRSQGLILGTTAYMEPPGRGESLAKLFSPDMSSTLAVRFFLAAFCGRCWMEDRA